MRAIVHLLVPAMLAFHLSSLGAVVRVECDRVQMQDRNKPLPATYEMLRGKAYGELKPEDLHSTALAGLPYAGAKITTDVKDNVIVN